MPQRNILIERDADGFSNEVFDFEIDMVHIHTDTQTSTCTFGVDNVGICVIHMTHTLNE